MIPLNPLTHPSNDVSVFDSYEMISLSILIRPFLLGKPSVKFPATPTLIVSVIVSMSSERTAFAVSPVSCSTLTYLSILLRRSNGAP